MPFRQNHRVVIIRRFVSDTIFRCLCESKDFRRRLNWLMLWFIVQHWSVCDQNKINPDNKALWSWTAVIEIVGRKTEMVANIKGHLTVVWRLFCLAKVWPIVNLYFWKIRCQKGLGNDFMDCQEWLSRLKSLNAQQKSYSTSMVHCWYSWVLPCWDNYWFI